MDRSMDRGVDHHVPCDVTSISGARLCLSGTLSYRATDPLSIDLTIYGAGPNAGDVVWSFARCLLAEGVDQPSGLGDVRVWSEDDHIPGRRVVVVAVSGGEGEGVVRLAEADVRRFLTATYGLVAVAAESELLDIDGLLEALLGH